jgi:hypothetical protein
MDLLLQLLPPQLLNLSSSVLRLPQTRLHLCQPQLRSQRSLVRIHFSQHQRRSLWRRVQILSSPQLHRGQLQRCHLPVLWLQRPHQLREVLHFMLQAARWILLLTLQSPPRQLSMPRLQLASTHSRRLSLQQQTPNLVFHLPLLKYKRL